MEAANHGKPIWDQLIAYIGGGAYLVMQTATSVELETWINIGVGIALMIFIGIRSYYWVKHDGYEDKP